MNDENKDGEANEKKQKGRKERKRAYRLRMLVKDGKQISSEDKAWLEQYTEELRGRGYEPPGEDTGETSDDIPGDAGNEGVDTGETQNAPSPPRIFVAGAARRDDEDRDSAKGDWRKKYQRSASADGREKAVMFVANNWKNFLELANAQIVACGGTPFVGTIIDMKDLFNDIVITVDDLMPKGFALKPSHIVAVGTTATIAQRVYYHKRIIAMYEEHKRKQDAENTVRATVGMPPTPPTTPVPAPVAPTVHNEEIKPPEPTNGGTQMFVDGQRIEPTPPEPEPMPPIPIPADYRPREGTDVW